MLILALRFDPFISNFSKSTLKFVGMEVNSFDVSNVHSNFDPISIIGVINIAVLASLHELVQLFLVHHVGLVPQIFLQRLEADHHCVQTILV